MMMMMILKRYTLDETSLKINITATTDRATVVNIRFDITNHHFHIKILFHQMMMKCKSFHQILPTISNHAYFNLAGHGSGWEGLAEHSLQVAIIICQM